MFKRITFFVILYFCSSTALFAQTKDIVRVFDGATIEESSAIDNAVIIFGDLNVMGGIRNNAVVIGGDINISSTGRIGGDTVAILGRIHKEPGAEITGKALDLSLGRFWRGDASKLRSFSVPFLEVLTLGAIGFFAFAGFMAIFLLIAVLFTDKVGNVSYFIQRDPWKAVYNGLVIAVLILPMTIFLIISIIGIPLVPILFIIISAATLFGYTAVCQLIGLKLFKAVKRPGQPMLLEVIVGLAILGAISFIPVAGWIVKFVAWLAGLGATVSTKFGMRNV